MFSYLEKGISRNIWSCDVVLASDIDLLRIFMFFCIIFVISAPFSHHFLLHFDGFCSFTATSHVTTTASEMLCTKAFQETCGSVAAKRQKTKTGKPLTSVCVGLSVLTRFKVNIFPREQAPGQKYPPRILVSCRDLTYFVSKNTDCCHNLKNKAARKRTTVSVAYRREI